MKVGPITDSSSLLADITFWTGADSSSYSVADRIRNINEWYRVANSWIWNATGVWEFDDRNYTTLPIATANLVNGQGDYELPSTTQKVLRVDVKDKQGNWRQLQPFDQSQIDGEGYEEFEQTDGIPTFYDLMGFSLQLKPAPAGGDVTTTSGLQVHVSRDIDTFSVSDTSREPGFHPGFHRIVSLGASLDYLIPNDQDVQKTDRVRNEIQRYSKRLEKFYGARASEMTPRFIPNREPRI